MANKENSKKIVFPSCDLDLDPMTLIYELDLDIMEIYLYAKNQVPNSKHSKVIARTDTQTDRQTDATENITYPHTWVVMTRSKVVGVIPVEKSSLSSLFHLSTE